MENEVVVAEKDMNILGIKIKKGTQVKRLTDSMVSLTEVVEIGYYDAVDVVLTEVVEIGYYDAVDVVNEVRNKNKED